MTASDDEEIPGWPAPTRYGWGPCTVWRSNAGYGWELNVGRRFQVASRRATSRMWPRFMRGTDENCNRAVTLVAWPVGQATVWWEPSWRDTLCEKCLAEGL